MKACTCTLTCTCPFCLSNYLVNITCHPYQFNYAAVLCKVELVEWERKKQEKVIFSPPKGHSQCRMWHRTQARGQNSRKLIHEPQERLWILSLITQTFPVASKHYSFFSSFVACPEFPRGKFIGQMCSFSLEMIDKAQSLNVNTS